MKKSNKLLLGGFFILLLFIAAIHISLYAKYKAGDHTPYNAEDDLAPLSMHQFPNVLFVSVRNVPGATVKFSDVAQTEKGENKEIQYVQKGDTLQITGSGNKEGFQRPVAFYLPHKVTLSVYNSSLSFVAGKNQSQTNPVIHLQRSRAIFTGQYNPLQLGNLQIVASDSSAVIFRGNTQVTHLDLQLSNSAIETEKGNFGQLTIVSDSLSHIALPAKQLLKANIKTTTQ